MSIYSIDENKQRSQSQHVSVIKLLPSSGQYIYRRPSALGQDKSASKELVEHTHIYRGHELGQVHKQSDNLVWASCLFNAGLTQFICSDSRILSSLPDCA